MKRMVRWLIPMCLLLWAAPVKAQIYGTGAAAFVTPADPSSITVDGVMGEGEPWGDAMVIDVTKTWDGGWNNGMAPTPDIVVESRLLYANDTLYIFAVFEDYELFFNDEWSSDQMIVGVDPLHDPEQAFDGSWSGWPSHGADSIHSFRVGHNGFTIGADSVINTVDWLNGVVNIDEEQQTITTEMAIYVPGLRAGSMIGFNIGGTAATAEPPNGENFDYAWFSWGAQEYAGSDILRRTDSYGTLVMVAEGEARYGTGLGALIARVTPGSISIDGMMGENEPWGGATVIDVTDTWDGGWNNGMAPTPDIVVESRVAYANDTLYVFAVFEDYELFFNDEWSSDQMIVGVDPLHDPEQEFDGSWSGWPSHGADSIHSFRVGHNGFTIGADSVINTVDWLNGVVIIDEEQQTITTEMAIYVPGLQSGSMIGFNIGGTAATAVPPNGENFDYAWFSWGAQEYAGSDILRRTDSYGTLVAIDFLIGTGVEEDYSAELPERFALKQNYPNPFNPTTTFEYDLVRSGRVTLEVFDLLGRSVATLVNDERPAGTYTLRWDASGLSSGTYVYQLRVAGEVVGSRMLMLVK